MNQNVRKKGTKEHINIRALRKENLIINKK